MEKGEMTNKNTISHALFLFTLLLELSQLKGYISHDINKGGLR